MSEHESHRLPSSLEQAQRTFPELADFLSALSDTIPASIGNTAKSRLRRHFGEDIKDAFCQLRDVFMLFDGKYHESIALYFSGYPLDSLEHLTNYPYDQVENYLNETLSSRTDLDAGSVEPQIDVHQLKVIQPLLERDTKYLYRIFGDTNYLSLTKNDAETIAAVLNELDVNRRSSDLDLEHIYTRRFKGETHAAIAKDMGIDMTKIGSLFHALSTRLQVPAEHKQMYRDLLQIRIGKQDEDYRKDGEAEWAESSPLSEKAHQLLYDIFGDCSQLELTTFDAETIAAVIHEIDTTRRKTPSFDLREVYRRYFEGATAIEIATELSIKVSDVSQSISKLRLRMYWSTKEIGSLRMNVLRARLNGEEPVAILIKEKPFENPTVSAHQDSTVLPRVDTPLPRSEPEPQIYQYYTPEGGREEYAFEDEGRLREGELWQDLALCTQIDPEIFFPEKGGSTREAKRVCGECAVKETCLLVALDSDERFGIWGGYSERERRKMKRERTLKQGFGKVSDHIELFVQATDALVDSHTYNSSEALTVICNLISNNTLHFGSEVTKRLLGYYAQDTLVLSAKDQRTIKADIDTLLAFIEGLHEEFDANNVDEFGQTFYEHLLQNYASVESKLA